MTKQTTYIAIIILCSSFLIAWVNITKPTKRRFVYPKNWPKPSYDFKANPLTEEGITLGKKLFYDPLLAADSVTSCASCHQQFAAFSTYDHPLSHGINNQFTKRNAPALQQLAWQKVFHADGGINHLDVQFLSPLTNTNEMGADLKNVVNYLQKRDDYKQLFKKAFGSEEVTTQKMGKALSQFLLTLVSSNSKYDRVMKGVDSFILPEKLGYGIFLQKCANCHPEPFFTDFNFHNIGLPLDIYNIDEGKMVVTGKSADSLLFRTPSLRNVMVTAPYGHDGRFFSLYNVLQHYRKGVVKHASTDSLVQNGIPLSNYEIGQITAFLQTLTDSIFLTNPAFAENNRKELMPFKHIH